MKTLKDRWSAKTPTFWKKVQRVGLVAGALGAALIAAPVALPAVLVTASGYLVAVGGVTAALSQLTVEDKKESED
jgi:ABC-type xylose transport system permease subunit